MLPGPVGWLGAGGGGSQAIIVKLRGRGTNYGCTAVDVLYSHEI